jgi:hypothetical protein
MIFPDFSLQFFLFSEWMEIGEIREVMGGGGEVLDEAVFKPEFFCPLTCLPVFFHG